MFEFMQSPKWTELSKEEQQKVITLSFEDQITSRPAWQEIDSDEQVKIKQMYMADAEQAHIKATAVPDRTTTMDVITNIGRGIADLSSLAGYGLKTLDPEGGVTLLDQIGQKMIDVSDFALESEYLRPDESEVSGEDGYVKTGIMQGLRSAGPSLAPLGTGLLSGMAMGSAFGPLGTVVGGFAGTTAATLGLFGLGTYGQKLEEYEQKGINEQEAHKAAFKQALTEAGIEEVSNLLGLKILGFGKVATQPLVKTAKELLSTPITTFAKNLGLNAIQEGTTEVIQSALGSKIDENLGILPEGQWQKAAVDSIIPAFTMSVLFGVGAQGMTTMHHKQLRADLESNDVEKQTAASREIAKNIKDPELKQAWIGMAGTSIAQNKPIQINADFTVFKDLETIKEKTGLDTTLSTQITQAKSVDEAIQITSKGIKDALNKPSTEPEVDIIPPDELIPEEQMKLVEETEPEKPSTIKTPLIEEPTKQEQTTSQEQPPKQEEPAPLVVQEPNVEEKEKEIESVVVKQDEEPEVKTPQKELKSITPELDFDNLDKEPKEKLQSIHDDVTRKVQFIEALLDDPDALEQTAKQLKIPVKKYKKQIGQEYLQLKPKKDKLATALGIEPEIIEAKPITEAEPVEETPTEAIPITKSETMSEDEITADLPEPEIIPATAIAIDQPEKQEPEQEPYIVAGRKYFKQNDQWVTEKGNPTKSKNVIKILTLYEQRRLGQLEPAKIDEPVLEEPIVEKPVDEQVIAEEPSVEPVQQEKSEQGQIDEPAGPKQSILAIDMTKLSEIDNKELDLIIEDSERVVTHIDAVINDKAKLEQEANGVGMNPITYKKQLVEIQKQAKQRQKLVKSHRKQRQVEEAPITEITQEKPVQKSIIVKPKKPENSWMIQNGFTDELQNVIYEDDQVGLLLGYNESGYPVFVPMNKTRRTTYDIDARTPDFISSEQAKKLQKAKQEHLAKEAELEKTSKMFKKSNVETTASITKKYQNLVKSWLKAFGLNTKVFIVARDDITSDMKETYELYGHYGNVLSSKDHSNDHTRVVENSQNSERSFHYIILNDVSSTAEAIEILAHEFGHVIQTYTLDNASQEVKIAFQKAYTKWAKKAYGLSTSDEFYDHVKPYMQAQKLKQKYGNFELVGRNVDPFLTSREFWAEQVSKWLTTDAKPQTVLDKFFSTIADMYRKLFKSIDKEKFKADKAIADFLNSQFQIQKAKHQKTILRKKNTKIQSFIKHIPLGKKISQPFSNYLGHKKTLLEQGYYNDLFNLRDQYDRIIDIFGGSGAVSKYLLKDSDKYGILNDADKNVFNMHQMSKEKLSEILNIIQDYAKQENQIRQQYPNGGKQAHTKMTLLWHQFKQKAKESNDPIIRAANYIMLKSGYVGLGSGQNFIYGKQKKYAWKTKTNQSQKILTELSQHAEEIQNLTITNQTAQELIQKTNANDLLIIDPPYIAKEKSKKVENYPIGKDLTILSKAIDFIKNTVNQTDADIVYTNHYNKELEKTLYNLGFDIQIVAMHTRDSSGGGSVIKQEIIAKKIKKQNKQQMQQNQTQLQPDLVASKWYSRVAKAIENSNMKSATGLRWLNQIKKYPGVKQIELRETGLEDYLKDFGSERIFKVELIDWFKINQIYVDEVANSLNKEEVAKITQLYDQSTQAWKDFKDLLTSLKLRFNIQNKKLVDIQTGKVYSYEDWDQFSSAIKVKYAKVKLLAEQITTMKIKNQNKHYTQYEFPQYQTTGGKNYHELILTLPGEELYTKDAHWPEIKNPLVHVRMKDRIINGEKVLHIEEFQSDWDQDFRQKGEAVAGGIARNPFSENAIRLMLKRMVIYAAENDYDCIAWSGADIQTERWGSEVFSWKKSPQLDPKIDLNQILEEYNLDDLEARYNELAESRETYNTEEQKNAAKMQLIDAEQQYDMALNDANKAIQDVLISQGETNYTIVYEVANWVLVPVNNEQLAMNITRADNPQELYERLQKINQKDVLILNGYEQIGGNVFTGMEANLADTVITLKNVITNRQDVYDHVKTVMMHNEENYSAENWEKRLNNITDKIWSQMQESETGQYAPRAEGMKEFYNKQLFNMFNKTFGKASWGKPAFSFVEQDGYKLPSMEITDKMKRKALYEGMPLFNQTQLTPNETQNELGEVSEKSSLWQSAKYAIVDILEPVSEVYKSIHQAIPERADFRLKERLRRTKTAAELKGAKQRFYEPIKDLMIQYGFTTEQVDEALYSRHAPEANARLVITNAKRFLLDLANDTNDQALTKMIKDIDKKFNDEEIPNKETQKEYLKLLNKRLKNPRTTETQKIAKAWNEFKEKPSGMTTDDADTIYEHWESDQGMQEILSLYDQMTQDTLRTSLESGRITPKEFQALSETFNYYTPLLREGFAAQPGNRNTGSGLINLRKDYNVRGGSTKKAVNMLGNGMLQHSKAIVRAQKAESLRAFINLVKLNPNKDFWTIERENLINRYDRHGNIVKDLDRHIAENEIPIKVDGKYYVIWMNPDNQHAQRIADYIKGNADKTGPLVRGLGRINRFLASVNTSLNPRFLLTNLPRDIQIAMVNLKSTELKDFGLDVFNGMSDAYKGLQNYLRGDVSSDQAKWAKEFIQSGGMMDWADYSKDAETQMKKLDKEIKLVQSKNVPLKTIKKVFTTINDYNSIAENVVRLSAYTKARKLGMSQDKAALLAKELTVNFDQKGLYGPVMNSLYLFSNAGIQGSVRLISGLRKSKEARKMMMKFMTAAVGMTIANSFMAGTDEDDESYYEKIKQYDKERNLIIMIPDSEGHYIKIPLGWGLNFFWNVGVEAGEAILAGLGKKKSYDPMAGVSNLMKIGLNAFNPIASATWYQTAMPTLLDPIAQVQENKTWTGAPLMPEQNPYAKIQTSDAQRFWKSVRPTSKFVSEMLTKVTGGDKVEAGKIDISPETLDLLQDTLLGGAGRFFFDVMALPAKLASDEELTERDMLFGRSFYGSPDQRKDANEYYDNIKDVLLLDEKMDVYPEQRKDFIRDKRFRLINEVKAVERRLRNLRLMKDKARTDKMKERIDQMILKEQKRFNKRYTKRMG